MTARLEKAQQLHQQGELEQAQALYQQLLAEDPRDIAALHSLAVLYSQSQQHLKAIELIERANQLQSAHPALLNSLGNIYQRAGYSDKAIKAFEQLTQLKPGYAIGWSNLGNAYQTLELFEQAQQAYQRAIELDSSLTDAQYNYATMLAKQADYDNAKAHFLSILSDQKHHGPSLGQLAQIAIEQQQHQQAVDYLQQRLALEEHHADTHHDLGLLILKEGDLKSALPLLRRALDLGTQIEDAHFNYATALLANNEEEEALTHYLRQLEIQPSAQAYYNIGVILMNKQRHKEALEYFYKMLELEPEHLDTLLNIAGLYLKMDRTDKAIKVYQQAQHIEPDNTEIKHVLTALTQQGTPEQAPNSYVEHLFDQYANHYDKHLTEYLRYDGPAQLRQLFDQENQFERSDLVIVDAGCGTGLSGQAFKNVARELIGIDLSAKMLAAAEFKEIYTQLIQGDVVTELKQLHQVDLIIAAELCNYLGDLAPFFQASFNSLTPNGQLFFTVESGQTYPYHLEKSIRYTHHKKYLEEQLNAVGFKLERFDNMILRKQHRDDVAGYLVLVTK